MKWTKEELEDFRDGGAPFDRMGDAMRRRVMEHITAVEGERAKWEETAVKYLREAGAATSAFLEVVSVLTEDKAEPAIDAACRVVAELSAWRVEHDRVQRQRDESRDKETQAQRAARKASDEAGALRERVKTLMARAAAAESLLADIRQRAGALDTMSPHAVLSGRWAEESVRLIRSILEAPPAAVQPVSELDGLQDEPAPAGTLRPPTRQELEAWVAKAKKRIASFNHADACNVEDETDRDETDGCVCPLALLDDVPGVGP